jgi:hypothetical protein
MTTRSYRKSAVPDVPSLEIEAVDAQRRAAPERRAHRVAVCMILTANASPI